MSQSPEFLAFAARLRQAVDNGLVAAAYVYRNRVVEKLSQGYTSGAFVTPHVALTVEVSPPRDDPERGRSVSVGTNVMYALYWEAGHMNIFTRRYERVEHWRISLLETEAEQFAAFTRVFARAFEAGRAAA